MICQIIDTEDIDIEDIDTEDNDIDSVHICGYLWHFPAVCIPSEVNSDCELILETVQQFDTERSQGFAIQWHQFNDSPA